MIKFFLFIFSLNFLIYLFKNIISIFFLINLLFIFNFIFTLNYFYLINYWNNLNKLFAIDSLSFILILLTIWLLTLSIFARKIPLSNKFKIIFLNILILLINILIITFRSINLIIFYIFFERRLIPIILIIIGWGFQIDKIQARIYIIFYTLFGSLPLLIILIYIYYRINRLIWNFIILKNLFNNNFFIYLILNRAFLIKLPIYFTHLWLPKAHVEAPIRGSIILAGIILKLGTYGIYRNILSFPKISNNFNLYFIIILIIGRILSRITNLNHTDLKIIVAYSSIVHINMIIARIISIIFLRLKGRIIIIIGHGLCSSGIFFLVNLNYEKLHSRNIFFNKGFLIIFPSLTLWWFLIFTSNFAAPPSLNLFGEILLINSLLNWNFLIILPIFLISFFRTCYSIFVYSFTQYGKINLLNISFKIIEIRELLINIFHWLPLNILFLNLNLF